MDDSGETVRRRLIYTGRVQGVGFRYTTASIARRHQVVGFVRNLADGSVELVADGLRAALEEFLGEIAATFARNIEESRNLPADQSGRFDRFEIRH